MLSNWYSQVGCETPLKVTYYQWLPLGIPGPVLGGYGLVYGTLLLTKKVKCSLDFKIGEMLIMLPIPAVLILVNETL